MNIKVQNGYRHVYDNFADPDVVGSCSQCGCDICDGDTIYTFPGSGSVVCEDCFEAYLDNLRDEYSTTTEEEFDHDDRF